MGFSHYNCNLIRKYNPDCKIKVNTVVNKLNKDEIMYDIINHAKIDRWKVIKMRPFKNSYFSNLNIAISMKDYEAFLDNNKNGNNIIKEETVRASYIIIDSNGCLIDNSIGFSHKLLKDCRHDSFNNIFEQLSFDKDLYFSRYKEAVS